MIEIKDMPLLPGQKVGENFNTVEVDKLAEVGQNRGAFSLHEGDKIEFPNQDPIVAMTLVRPAMGDASPKAYYVAVTRNGQNSWLPIGVLTRRDATNRPLGKIQEELLAYPSFKEVYEHLKGKTLVAGKSVTHKFAHFDGNGNRVDGEFDERAIPELQYE
jgi:hypothetical protein